MSEIREPIVLTLSMSQIPVLNDAICYGLDWTEENDHREMELLQSALQAQLDHHRETPRVAIDVSDLKELRGPKRALTIACCDRIDALIAGDVS